MTDSELIQKLKAAGYNSAKIVSTKRGKEVQVTEDFRTKHNSFPLFITICSESGRSTGCGGVFFQQITESPCE